MYGMNGLQKFFYGRYGIDKLSKVVIFTSVIINFLLLFLNQPWITFIIYIPLAWCIFRMLSKNISKRREENEKFLKIWYPIQNWFKIKINRFKDKKTHKYFKCPECNQTVRVPKNRGKICIVCPKCKIEFIKKT